MTDAATEYVKKRATTLAELGEIFAHAANPERTKASIEAFVPRPTDVVITPYGKSGTTWTQQIFHTLRTRGDMDFDDISRVVPWIETSGAAGIDINAEQRADPRGFKSHLTYEKLPQGSRVINIIRNPVDVAFSAFKFMEGWYIEPGTIGADEFVQAGLADANYPKHFLSWWARRHDENVLYLVYEHMKQDLEGTIEAIAAFVDIDLDDELRRITLEHASLPFMQAHKDRFDDAIMRKLSEETLVPSGSDSAKVRAGKVGDHGLSDETVAMLQAQWQEYITPVTGFETYDELIDSLA